MHCILTRRTIYLAALALCATALLFAQQALTNEKIVAMAKAHLRDSAIIDTIRTSPANFSLNADALIALKKEGISDDVIDAMQAKMATKRDAPQSASSRSAAREPPPQDQQTCPPGWSVNNIKDPITGESLFEGIMCARADDRGSTFQVTSSCNLLGLKFKIVYLSGFDEDLGYKLEPGNFLLRQPHVMMRLAIDGKAGSAPSITSDFKNEATLGFSET